MLNIRMQDQSTRLKPKITVIGVGGAGGNAVNNMISSGLEGCEFLVCNTDAQALEGSIAQQKIQLGANVTRGLGAGANPETGRAAAEETIEEILGHLEGSNMVFVTAGMGGGTGTGAAPVLAQAARDQGILTIGVVTKPFHFEGTHRMQLADSGIEELQKVVDTLIVIPNQNLFRIANEKTTFADAFKLADEVLQSGVRGVTDLMVMPGLINLDFADIRTVMAEMGKAMMGTGEADGDRRAVEAAEAAISNPLLDDVSMKGARGVLINITGGLDMTLYEVDEAANRIRDEVDTDANIIFGSTFDEALEGIMRVSVVATGIDAQEGFQQRPVLQQSVSVKTDTQARPQGAQAETVGAGAASTTTKAPTGLSGRGGYGGAPNVPHAATLPPKTPAYTGQPTAYGAGQQPTAQAGGQQATSEQPQQTGSYEGTAESYTAATATARKVEPEPDTEATQTRPLQSTPAVQRSTPPVSQPARGLRHGNTFIPPKPVDPRLSGKEEPGLFDEDAGSCEEEKAESYQEQPQAEQPQRKSPSLFERFTGQKREEQPQQPEHKQPQVQAEVQQKLSIEPGGKHDEDELDIPAFLRRQAN